MTLPQHDEDAVCLCVYDHRPPVLEYTEHHRWPLGMGGPDTAENRVWLCPTTHYNVHELLRHMVRDGLMTYTQAKAMQSRPVSRYAYDVAVDGYLRWKATQPPTHHGRGR